MDLYKGVRLTDLPKISSSNSFVLLCWSLTSYYDKSAHECCIGMCLVHIHDVHIYMCVQALECELCIRMDGSAYLELESIGEIIKRQDLFISQLECK